MEKQYITLSVWLKQTRANFLILAAFLVAIGISLSYKYLPEAGEIAWYKLVFVLIGTVSAHISVNLFNEYSDFRSGIDFNTKRTPFSGGSGMLINGSTTKKQVFAAAIVMLGVSFVIGLYFCLTAHWSIILFIAIGLVSIIGYTDYLSKYLLGELFSGLSLGSLVVIGTYIALTAKPGVAFSSLLNIEILLISLPPGILTALLLLLNEFPDMEADKKGGRNHLVVKFGRKISAYIYTAGAMATFIIIFLMPVTGVSSYWIYLALLPFPLAINNSLTAIRHNSDTQKLMPALGGNVIVVLATDLLLAVSIVLAI